MSPRQLSAERLREVLSYDPATGEFRWLVSAGTVCAGTAAGKIRGDGYMRVQVDGRRYLAHRLAWLYMTGAWPMHQIDHINGNPSDNRLVNLREATHAENMRNCKLPVNNTSGGKGAYWRKNSRKWQAQIMVDGKRISLGAFPTAELAHAAYCVAAEKHHGEFARTA